VIYDRKRSPTSSCSTTTGAHRSDREGRQFCDYGHQYRTAIFVHNDEERKLAEASKKKIEAELKVPIYTEIDNAGPFYPAEEYHQNFYLKNRRNINSTLELRTRPAAGANLGSHKGDG